MDEQNIMQLNAEVQAKDAYAQEMKYAAVSGGTGACNADPSNTIANYHEREVESMKRIATRDDQELRLKCLQTTLQFAGGDMAKATNAAQLAYDFITGKRALSEVTGG